MLHLTSIKYMSLLFTLNNYIKEIALKLARLEEGTACGTSMEPTIFR